MAPTLGSQSEFVEVLEVLNVSQRARRERLVSIVPGSVGPLKHETFSHVYHLKPQSKNDLPDLNLEYSAIEELTHFCKHKDCRLFNKQPIHCSDTYSELPGHHGRHPQPRQERLLVLQARKGITTSVSRSNQAQHQGNRAPPWINPEYTLLHAQHH